jgi:hypothetical protein
MASGRSAWRVGRVRGAAVEADDEFVAPVEDVAAG